jgi:hypothetical protein
MIHNRKKEIILSFILAMYMEKSYTKGQGSRVHFEPISFYIKNYNILQILGFFFWCIGG